MATGCTGSGTRARAIGSTPRRCGPPRRRPGGAGSLRYGRVVPELHEAERARSLIAAHALGRRIVDVDDHDVYVSRPHLPGDIASALVGRRLTTANRVGKTLWCETDGNGLVL